MCVFVLPGDQQHVHGAPSDHLLRLHLPGEAAILDPHAGRRLLAAAVWYDHLEQPHTSLALSLQTWLSDRACTCRRFHREGRR